MKVRDSGVPWLGEIPAHWELWKVGHLARVGNGSTPERDNSEYWTDGSVPWLNSSVVNQDEVTTAEQFVTDLARRECHLPLLQPGTVLVAITGQGKTRGQAVVLSIPATINQHMAFVAPNPDLIATWFLRWSFYRAYEYLRSISDDAGGTKGALTCEDIANLRIPVPPLDEQGAIIARLAHETAHLGALLAAKQRLLDLLAEKRKAIIATAVTRGLDPKAKLRDSGVPWLGEIPAHWNMSRLKFVARVQTGIALGKDYAGQATSEFPYLRVANVQDGFIDLSEVKTMAVPEREAASATLRRGDVLMNEGGDADKLGRGAIWDASINPCLHQNHVFALRPMSVSSEWLSTWTGSEFAKAYFETKAKQSTNLASISSTNLLELPIAVPPDGEQHAIVEHIARATAKLDAVRAATERTLALLKERRAALIVAAVTGQLDVGAAA